jgi:hypothetical protein
MKVESLDEHIYMETVEINKKFIEKIIQEYLEANLSIRVEPDAFVDGRNTIFILLNDVEIDYDYIYP